jgi:Domain of Unknown Function (DUF1520).
MNKAIVAAALAAGVALTPLMAVAQGGQPGAGPRAEHAEKRGPRFSEADRAAFLDARIAGLKAGLKLTSEQEKHWPALETALRDMAKDRAEAMKKFRESRAERKQRPGAIERLEMRADFMEKRAAEMKKLAEAAKPLYDSLDEAQKGRFDVLMRAGMGPGHGPRVRHAGFHHRGAPPAPPAQQQQ